MRSKTVLTIVLVFVIGGLVGSWATAKTRKAPLNSKGPVSFLVSNAPGQAIGSQVSFTNGFAPVAKAVLPAVVNIASTKTVHNPDQLSPLFSDPLFRQFFGQGNSQFRVPHTEREHSLGSGVIVNGDGYILTNNHVVDGSSDIEVSLPDKRQFKGHVVGTDPKTDLAVVRIDTKGLTPVVLGDSSHVAVGDFALAVGNPFGVGETVTMGIISATGRGGLGIENYEDFIQTDAAINPGNSGGPLVNVQGQVVGINTAIITGGGEGGGNEGVGLAIPSNMAKNVMQQIVEHGKVVRGSMGVVIQPVTPDLATAFHLTGAVRGALVAQVNSGSPAEKAGLKSGDIILDLNGAPVTDSRDLSLKISTMSPGNVVRLKVVRDGKEQDVSVTLAELPAKAPATPAKPSPGGGTGLRLGISIETLTPALAQQEGLPAQTKGALITAVEPGSAAEAAGLRHGDVVLQVNHKPVAAADQLRSAVRQNGNQPVLLMIDRGGESLYVVVGRQQQ